jgi:protein Mpv17
MAAFRRFGAFYARSFERRPWVTLAIANGTLGAIADTLAQSLERYQKKGISPSVSSKESVVDSTTSIIKQETQQRDYMRTARFFAFGVMMAPLLDKWNRFIEFRLPLRAVGGSAAKVSMAALAKRVTVDQVGL